MPAWWIETPYPKTVRGVDLIGKELVLDPDRPPEDTSFSGMKMIFVKVVNPQNDAKYWITYKVMATERDITTAIGCMETKLCFTFTQSDVEKTKDVAHISMFERK